MTPQQGVKGCHVRRREPLPSTATFTEAMEALRAASEEAARDNVVILVTPAWQEK